MKRTISILITLFFFISLNAQTPPERTWYQNQKGQRTTVRERWGEDNTGLKHGSYIKYDENGNRIVYGNYNHGKKNGKWEETEVIDAMLASFTYLKVSNWKNDVADGEYKLIQTDVLGINALLEGKSDNTSVLITQGQYLNGKPTSFWKEGYSVKSKVFQEGVYKNGLRDGKWINTEIDQQQLKGTRKGYYVIYSNGDIVSQYDDSGIDIKEREKKEAEAKQIEDEYQQCKTIQDYSDFVKKHPTDKRAKEAKENLEALKKADENALLKTKEENIYLAPLLTKWKTLPDSSKNKDFFSEYYKKYPNGYKRKYVDSLIIAEYQKACNMIREADKVYDNENGELPQELTGLPKNIADEIYRNGSNYIRVKAYKKNIANISAYSKYFYTYPNGMCANMEGIKDMIVGNRDEFSSGSNLVMYRYQISYLLSLNTEQSVKIASDMTNVLVRFEQYYPSYGLEYSIYKALADWRLGNVESTLNEIKRHKNYMIQYSDGNVPYSKKVKEIYKDYKKKLTLPQEDETWDKIEAILSSNK